VERNQQNWNTLQIMHDDKGPQQTDMWHRMIDTTEKDGRTFGEGLNQKERLADLVDKLNREKET